jgi:tetratricopeptide (TPR) repeat protein
MATAQASQDSDLTFPAKGSLKRVSFPRILREVARSEQTGSLYLLSGQTKKVVFFEQGFPVFVRSNVLSECLGQILAHEGLITQEQCEQTLEAIRRTGKKQGELLVEMGILSEGNLRYGLEAQLRAKLFDIFSWEDGRYQFKHDPPNLQFGIKLDTTPEGVIIEAIQDQYDEARAIAALQVHHGKYPTLRRDEIELSQLGLLPEEQFHVERLDGSRTTEAIAAETLDPPVPSPAALLWGLLQAGLVQLSSRALPARALPTAPTFGPGDRTDAELAPSFAPRSDITEYEDTPLPGELPKSPDLLGDHEDDFAGVGDDSGPIQVSVAKEIPHELVAAQPDDDVDETFDDDAIELIDEDDMLEVDDDELGLGDFDLEASDSASDGDLADLDLDAVDLAEPAVELELEVVGLDESPEPASPEPLPSAATIPELSGARPEPTPVEPPLLEVGPTAVDRPAHGARPLDDGPPIDPVSLAADDDLSIDDDLGMDDDLGGLSLASIEAAGDDDLDLGEADALDLDGGDDDLDLALDGADDLALDGDAGDAGFDALSLEADEDLADLDDVDLGDGLELAADVPAHAGSDDALVNFDDLDAIDLGGPEPVSSLADDLHESIEPVSIDPISIEPGSMDPVSIDALPDDDEDDDNPEVIGAMKFNEAESALSEDRYTEAIDALEQAYENGFDVAELHAMLAYARFMESGQAVDASEHSLELLDYAQNMDPSLDLVHAYRGAIYRAIHQPDQAREALDRALELNPYCELAMEIMDSL